MEMNPQGVEALCAWLEQLRYRPWLDRWGFVLLPCLNPWGYDQDVRENPDGKDLNREFNAPHPAAEIRFVHPKLQQPFDLVIDLHDDRDSLGYYLYQNVDTEAEAVGRQILDRVGKVTSINVNSEIEGRAADRGVIDGPCNPETLAGSPGCLCSDPWSETGADPRSSGQVLDRGAGAGAPGGHRSRDRVLLRTQTVNEIVPVGSPMMPLKHEDRDNPEQHGKKLRQADRGSQSPVQAQHQVGEADIEKPCRRHGQHIGRRDCK